MAQPRAGHTPVIDGDRCSLGRLAQSTCAACVRSCPQDALGESDEGLLIDSAACTACGACVAACPQRAIGLRGLEEIGPAGTADRGGAVALICPARVEGAGPCLQALGIDALARLWLGGIRRIEALTADCATCPGGKGLQVAQKVADLNVLLADRGLPPLALEPARRGTASLPRLTAMAPPARGRRAFLGLGATAAGSETRLPRPLARLQSLSGPDAPRFAFAPRIDPDRCTGCDACMRICPETALSLIKDESGNLSYRAASANCTGCGMCRDVCSENAVMIEPMSPDAPDVALFQFRCRGCGVEVHVPDTGAAGKDGLCPVCARTRHHTRLYQVIE